MKLLQFCEQSGKGTSVRLKSGFDIAELLATQGVTWLPTAVHTVSKLLSAGRAKAHEALGL